MSKLPTDLSGREVRAALERAGFVFRRRAGSHMILRRDEPCATAAVPTTSRSDQARSANIITDAGLTIEQFKQLLGR